MRWGYVCLAGGLAAFFPSPAAACGGFFCSSAPVVQAREVVAYAYEDDGALTMAVQIVYQGRDEDFAWILPLPVPPDTIAVGTDALFDALSLATEPQFDLRLGTEGTCAQTECTFPSYGGGCGFGCAADASPAGARDAAALMADAGSVEILSRGVVGPYDTVVLGAASAADILEWLGDNDYDIPAASAPLLEPYVAQGFVFIALRLNANRDSSVIRPIVLRMATDEACLPIRLTAIATTPSLPIALFFLADRQAHSTNYAVADVPVDPGLWLRTRTWDGAVRDRVAELGGRAFATDYAGPTPRVSIALPDVLDLARETDPARFVGELRARGYPPDDLLLDLFERYIGPPGAQTARDYVNCLTLRGSTASCGAPTRFDAERLARAIEEEITAPRREADAMVARHPYLTRLSTSMRAEDMSLDPDFALDDGLPDVPQRRNARLIEQCSADYYPGRAPAVLEVGGVRYPARPGRTLSADAYCREMGGTARASSSGGCTAARGRGAPLMLVLAVGAFVAVRLTRRLRAPAR